VVTPRHAEIAGAGFAGLVAALALARRGWSVRVHERAPSLRSEGFGIAIHANGLRVLRALGVEQRVLEGGLLITALETRDAAGRTMSRISPRIPTRRIARHHLVQTLSEAAAAQGVAIRHGAEAAAAEPGGVLVTADGARWPADLVVAADGINSRLRESLGLRVRRHLLPDGATRLLVRRDGLDDAGPAGAAAIETWSGARRIIMSPVSAAETYLAMSCLHADEEGRRVPLDLASWIAAFPHLAGVIERAAAETDWRFVRWDRFQVLRLDAWSRGRVVVLGDAAHAMPPNLGQGGGCAMMGALALAVHLDGTRDVPAALRAFEAAERPLIEHTQRWSRRYGRVTGLPSGLRKAVFRAIDRVPWLRAQHLRAANHVPTGTG
jgi:2-polyprenyl-6-methoxyphenol hydroxylase-like FAD-dependent oxidoreductase